MPISLTNYDNSAISTTEWYVSWSGLYTREIFAPETTRYFTFAIERQSTFNRSKWIEHMSPKLMMEYYGRFKTPWLSSNHTLGLFMLWTLVLWYAFYLFMDMCKCVCVRACVSVTLSATHFKNIFSSTNLRKVRPNIHLNGKSYGLWRSTVWWTSYFSSSRGFHCIT